MDHACTGLESSTESVHYPLRRPRTGLTSTNHLHTYFYNLATVVENAFRDFEFPKDIYQANKTILGLFFHRSAPFNQWKSDEYEIPANIEIMTQIACQFLMLRCWFWFVSKHHGQIAEKMIKDEFSEIIDQIAAAEPRDDINFNGAIDFYFGKIDKAIEVYRDAPPERKTLTLSNGEELTLPWEYYLAVKILLSSEESPYCNSDTNDFEGNDILMMNLLLNSRFIAEATFARFKEGYVDFDAGCLKSWQWRPNAGLHEQHLMRRFNSIFFDKDRRHVTPKDVYVARYKDDQEWASYYQHFLTLKKEILEDDSPSSYVDFISTKREEIDALIDDVARLGVGANGLDVELDKLRESLIFIWRYIYEQQRNTKGLELLEQAEELHKQYAPANRPRLINAMAHESMPLEEVVASALSLAIDDLREYVNYFNSSEMVEHLSNKGQDNIALLNLRTGALDLVRKNYTELKENGMLEMVEKKLAIIGVAL